jgi:hypothetical protein
MGLSEIGYPIHNSNDLSQCYLLRLHNMGAYLMFRDTQTKSLSYQIIYCIRSYIYKVGVVISCYIYKVAPSYKLA